MTAIVKASWLPRLLGGITAAYSAAIIVRPEILAGPCKLTGPGGRAPQSVRLLTTAIGARDLVNGLAMVLAPPGRPLRTAIAIRVLSDAADAVAFGSLLPDHRARIRIGGFAAAWAVLCAVGATTQKA